MIIALFGTMSVVISWIDRPDDDSEAIDNHFSGVPFPLPFTLFSVTNLSALFYQEFVCAPPDFKIDPVFFYP